MQTDGKGYGMFYVLDPFAPERARLIAGPFDTFEEARTDASERNTAGDLLIVRPFWSYARRSTSLETVGDAWGTFAGIVA